MKSCNVKLYLKAVPLSLSVGAVVGADVRTENAVSLRTK